MPVKSLYNFSSAGITYYISYDTDAQVVQVDTDPADATPAAAVSPLVLGKAIGTVLHHECIGFTQLKVTVWSAYPFAVVSKVQNAKSCGYIGPTEPLVCMFIDPGNTITNETVRGARDGIAVINVRLPFYTVEYSLDNIHWQSSNTFSGLTPGSYRYYVRATGNRCKKEGSFYIAPGAAAQEIVYPWTEKFCHLFRLRVGGIEYNISEPIKWDAVNMKAFRDKDTHGWKSQYSDENIELEFDCDAGKQLIQPQYDVDGSDAEVFFLYGITYQDIDYIFFEAKMNMNTYKVFPQKVSATVESVKYNPLILTRMDTKISMTATKSVDGEDIAPPPITTVSLHSKKLSRLFQVTNTTPVDTLPETVSGKRWILPDTSAASATEIEDGFTYSLQSVSAAPYDSSLYNWLIKYKGNYAFNIQFSLDIKFKSSIFTGVYTMRPYFMVNDERIAIGDEQAGTFDREYSTVTMNVNHQLERELKQGDEVYIFVEVDAKTYSFLIYSLAITQTSANIVVQALEQAESSTCKGWFLFDAINHVVRSITNGENYIKSNLLSLKGALQTSDGPGSLFITTNGKQIRKFDPDKNPLIISAKDLLSSVRALFCAGYGFETVAGVEVMRIERVDFFYRDREMLIIDECWDYREEVAKEMLYNEYEIGYEKYQDEGSNTLDEFNTKQEGIFPIKTNKLKFTQKSSLIASGYALEFSRRQQFATTSTNSYQNDDEGFIISVLRDGAAYKPERNEPFSAVSGVISPETAYNIRLSPKRMLLNWAIWLRNLFHYKSSTAKIKPTQHAQNGELTTQLSLHDIRNMGDINRQQIQENEEIDLANYPVEERLFRPEWIYFKAKLTPDKIQLINNAMKGGATEDKNYGWIAVKDYNGLYQAGFIYELDYNFFTEQATIKMLKKYGNPVTPGEVCCNYLSVNGCRILVNGQKIIL